MLKRALSLAEEYGMLPRGCAVLCAVSGGADSMTLLHWLSRQEGITLHAAHFDHRLRGEESTADAAFVREICGKWGIPFHLGEGDVRGAARASGFTLEEGARRLRYAFLEETAKTLGENTRIATAHTADDNAETVILNLVRGTGLKGLCGIPPVRAVRSPGVVVIRPLLTTFREEILTYLSENRIDHREDSSNTDVESHLHKFSRHLHTVGKAVHHASGLLRAILFHDPHRVSRCFPGVDDDRHIHLPRQLQLPCKPMFLNFSVGLRPVIIKSDLSHCHSLIIRELSPDLLQQFFRHFRAVLRVNSQGAVNMWKPVSQIKALVYTPGRRGNIHHASDPCRRKSRQQLIPVAVKSFVVIMCMCIKNHLCPLLEKIIKKSCISKTLPL